MANRCPNCDRPMLLRGASVMGGTAAECPLHAAAPALLEALEDAATRLGIASEEVDGLSKAVFQKWENEARVAIAQAKGETP